MRLAAPDFSKIAPIMMPKPMMIPMLPSVPPKPVVMELMMPNVFPSSKVMFVKGMPPTTPTMMVEMISAKNACTFVFSTKKISTIIPMARPINILSPLNPPIIVITSLK